MLALRQEVAVVGQSVQLHVLAFLSQLQDGNWTVSINI